MKNLRKSAISGIKWTTVSTIISALFQLLQISILTRFLPKYAFGLVAMASFTINFSNVFVDMGINSAILHRHNISKNEYSSIYWLNIFISIILYFILFFIAPFIAVFYNELELLYLIPILGINLLLIAIGRQHRTIMQKQFRFKLISIIEIISIFIGLIIAILLAVNDFGVYSMVYSTLVAAFASNLLFLILNLRTNSILFHFRWIDTKPFLRIGGFTMGSTLLDFFSRETDVLIIGKMLGLESLGIYSLSKQIVMKLFQTINPIIVNVLSPLLASIQTQKLKLKTTYLMIIKYLAYFSFPIYLVVIVASKEILFYAYGKNYSNSFLVLSFLAFSYCITSLGNPVGSLQIATGRTDIGFKWTILRVLITPLFIYFGAKQDITTVSAFYALLTVIFIIPSWYMMLRPMANIKLFEYLNQFYKPFIFFASSLLFLYMFGSKIDLVENFLFNGCVKVLIFFITFTVYILLVDRKNLIDFFNLIVSIIKK